MNKPILHFIFRGYLYKENWIPVSVRGRFFGHGPYNIDFTKKSYIEHLNLINNLKEKYDVQLYFSTYDTTPENVISFVNEKFNPKEIILSPEKNSNQFTTLRTALHKIKKEEGAPSLTMVLRPDIFITDKLISLIVNFEYGDDRLYVLCREHNRNYFIDIFHCFSNNIFDSFSQYLTNGAVDGKCRRKDELYAKDGSPRALHRIHKHILTQSIVPKPLDHPCKRTMECDYYFTVPNKKNTR